MKKQAILIDPGARTVRKVKVEDDIFALGEKIQSNKLELYLTSMGHSGILFDEDAKIGRSKALSFRFFDCKSPSCPYIDIIGKALVVSVKAGGHLANVKATVTYIADRTAWTTTEQN